ncbi:MAG TPA: DNA mismatch repair protein MutS, partial [Gemmatimonadales bacterium]|nr:DNA mismatch repair protein MutS [Gemmatimonadales bacterium]
MSTGARRSSTPLMQQYREIKARHQDAILFFRMGDFYEMFFDDAELGARVLDITLTSRGDGVPLAGVPVKAAADYLRQLVTAGHRVAICEQVEDPRLAKGIVRREVVETVTPGAMLQDGWLPGSRNNYLVALSIGSTCGLAAVDLSTGEFLLESIGAEGVAEALARLAPQEIVAEAGAAIPVDDTVMRTAREAWEFDPELARDDLCRRFSLASLDGLGVGADDAAAVGAAGALLRYLAELQPAGLPHLARPVIRRSSSFLWLDEMTRRNLELVEPLRAGARGATLLESLDATVTPMGARLLRQWLLSPLATADAITARLDAVDVLAKDHRSRERLRDALDGVRDLERLAGRAAAGRATPREMAALRDSLSRLPDVLDALRGLTNREASRHLARVEQRFDLHSELTTQLSSALTERPPAVLNDGGVIRPGFDAELDELRDLRDGGKRYIATLQQRERERTGISSLKVGFNKVFGYFLEVTHSQASRVPSDYERRQTLSGAERYVTPELKEYESRVLGAEERLLEREAELFARLRADAGAQVAKLQASARALAALDVFASLAEQAVQHGYVRPVIEDGFGLQLVKSR